MITISIGTDEKNVNARTQKGKSLVDFPNEYVVIDIETTGLSPEWDSIIEVSGIKYENGIERGRFTSLVQPDNTYSDGSYIDDFIEELTGITNDMLAAAPKAKEILPQFKDFISNSVLIGHNVNFDINFLYDNFDKYLSTPLLNNFIDTMRISRRLHPEERHHRLMDLCERYNINYAGAHRAIFDCEITQQCWDIMKAEIIERFQSFDAFKNQIKTIKRGVRASDITAANEEFDETHPLYGKVCVFTGTLQKMTRKEAMQIVVNFGGINGDTVTKKTNFLVLGNNDYCSTIKDGKSTKQKKAEKLILSGADLVILSENVFYDLIN